MVRSKTVPSLPCVAVVRNALEWPLVAFLQLPMGCLAGFAI